MEQIVNIHTHHPRIGELTPRTAGIHPWQASEADPKVWPEGIQAIGEIGLDKACGADFEQQKLLFTAQLQQACERGLPVVIHCVRAFDEVCRALAELPPRAVIFHGFIGSPEQALEAVKRGYYLSFGARTFASPKTLAALRATPLDRLFVETDDDLTPIEDIYTQVAAARATDVATLQRATTENYQRIFPNELSKTEK